MSNPPHWISKETHPNSFLSTSINASFSSKFGLSTTKWDIAHAAVPDFNSTENISRKEVVRHPALGHYVPRNERVPDYIDWLNVTTARSEVQLREALDNGLTAQIRAIEGGTVFMLCVLGFLANLLIVMTLIKRDQLSYPSNRLVLSLTLSNLFLCVLVYPFIGLSSIYGKWTFPDWWCSSTGFLSMLVWSASLVTVAMIAVDRYYAIQYPMRYSSKMTRLKMGALLGVTWLLAAFVAIPPFIPLEGFPRYQYSKNKNGCLLNWHGAIIYAHIFSCLYFVVPIVILLCCYTIILRVARKKARKVHVGTMSEVIRDDIHTITSFSEPSSMMVRSSSFDATSSDGRLQRPADHPTNIPLYNFSDIPKLQIRSGEHLGNNNLGYVPSHSETCLDENLGNSVEISPDARVECRVCLALRYKQKNNLSLQRQETRKISHSDENIRRMCCSCGGFTTNYTEIILEAQRTVSPKCKSSLQHKISMTLKRGFSVTRRTSHNWFAASTSPAKGVWTVLVLVGGQVITCFPYMLLSVSESYVHKDISHFVEFFSVCALLSSSLLYPLLYGVYNRTLRKEIKLFLRPPAKRAARGLPKLRPRQSSYAGSVLDLAPSWLRPSSSISLSTPTVTEETAKDLKSLPTPEIVLDPTSLFPESLSPSPSFKLKKLSESKRKNGIVPILVTAELSSSPEDSGKKEEPTNNKKNIRFLTRQPHLLHPMMNIPGTDGKPLSRSMSVVESSQQLPGQQRRHSDSGQVKCTGSASRDSGLIPDMFQSEEDASRASARWKLDPMRRSKSFAKGRGSIDEGIVNDFISEKIEKL